MMGGILNTINVRLDADTIAFILQHGEAKILLTDREFSEITSAALELVGHDVVVVNIDDVEAVGGEFIGDSEFENFIEILGGL